MSWVLRHKVIVGATLAAVAVLALLGVTAFRHMFPPSAMSFAGGETVALSLYKGPTPVGVPPELRDASLVERGKYLTEAADCQACHTAAGGRPFAGGRAFDTGFGILYSPNITADAETGIGSWSDADFARAVHEGISKDGSRLYPAFPYESYSALADDDVRAIRSYLFSLPAIHAPPPQNQMQFPANQRWLMAFWSLFYNPDRRFEPHVDRSPEWNRGAYVVEALAHCGDCHTPRNLGQALDNGRKFSGAVIEGWRAFNITQDPASGLGDWTDQQITDYLSKGHAAGRGAAGGPMAEAVDVSLSKVAPSDMRAMVVYLRTIPSVSSPDLPSPRTELAPDTHRGPSGGGERGKQVFEGACVSCHGWSGQSGIAPEATLIGARSVNDVTAVNAAQAILNGIQRPGPLLSMPTFRDAYSDAEIAAVANFVTSRFGTAGSALTSGDVAKLRTQTSTPGR